MATRRTLDTRSTARALYYTNAFAALRVLACTASAGEWQCVWCATFNTPIRTYCKKCGADKEHGNR